MKMKLTKAPSATERTPVYHVATRPGGIVLGEVVRPAGRNDWQPWTPGGIRIGPDGRYPTRVAAAAAVLEHARAEVAEASFL